MGRLFLGLGRVVAMIQQWSEMIEGGGYEWNLVESGLKLGG
jgi:hypothetical protein